MWQSDRSVLFQSNSNRIRSTNYHEHRTICSDAKYEGNIDFGQRQAHAHTAHRAEKYYWSKVVQTMQKKTLTVSAFDAYIFQRLA